MTAHDWHSEYDMNCLHGSSWYEGDYILPAQKQVYEYTHADCVDKYEKLRVKHVELLRKYVALEDKYSKLIMGNSIWKT